MVDELCVKTIFPEPLCSYVYLKRWFTLFGSELDHFCHTITCTVAFLLWSHPGDGFYVKQDKPAFAYAYVHVSCGALVCDLSTIILLWPHHRGPPLCKTQFNWGLALDFFKPVLTLTRFLKPVSRCNRVQIKYIIFLSFMWRFMYCDLFNQVTEIPWITNQSWIYHHHAVNKREI